MTDLSRRRFVAGGLALGSAATFGSPTLLRSAGAQAAPPTAPRLARGPDSSRSMWVSWSTAGPVSGLAAEIGTADGFGQPLTVETAVDGSTPRPAPPTSPPGEAGSRGTRRSWRQRPM